MRRMHLMPQMTKHYLTEYRQREVDDCSVSFCEPFFKAASTNDKWRRLLPVTSKRQIVYCESGGIQNLLRYPPDHALIMKVMPYKTRDAVENRLGPLNDFFDLCESGRIIPTIQDP